MGTICCVPCLGWGLLTTIGLLALFWGLLACVFWLLNQFSADWLAFGIAGIEFAPMRGVVPGLLVSRLTVIALFLSVGFALAGITAANVANPSIAATGLNDTFFFRLLIVP